MSGEFEILACSDVDDPVEMARNRYAILIGLRSTRRGAERLAATTKPEESAADALFMTLVDYRG